jgi:hypothetical protein
MRTPTVLALMALVGAVLEGSACSAAPQAPAEPSPTATAMPVERAALPLPSVPPSPANTLPQTVQVVLEAQEVEGRVADGVAFTYWTFGGSVPGTFLRVREGRCRPFAVTTTAVRAIQCGFRGTTSDHASSRSALAFAESRASWKTDRR